MLQNLSPNISLVSKSWLSIKDLQALTVSSDSPVEMGESHDGFNGRTSALLEWL